MVDPESERSCTWGLVAFRFLTCAFLQGCCDTVIRSYIALGFVVIAHTPDSRVRSFVCQLFVPTRTFLLVLLLNRFNITGHNGFQFGK